MKLFKDKKTFYFLLGRILFRYGIIFLIASWIVWDYSFSSSKVSFDAATSEHQCQLEITPSQLTIKIDNSLDLFLSQTECQLSMFGKKY